MPAYEGSLMGTHKSALSFTHLELYFAVVFRTAVIVFDKNLIRVDPEQRIGTFVTRFARPS